MNISNFNLIQLIQSYNLQQDITSQAIINDEIQCFEQILKSQLTTSKESILNSNQSNTNSSLDNLYIGNNNQFVNYLSELFCNIINPTLLNNTSIAQNNNAQIYSQYQVKQKNSSSSGGYDKLFNGDVFLGDSITKGLSAYKILDDSKVYAEVGIGTKKVKELVDSAAKQNPKKVFIMIGINDIGSYTTNQFANYYSNLINTVKAKCPNAEIFVQSILPVLSQATQKNPSLNNTRISEFNSIILQISKKENVGFINTSALINNENLYANDGIHYKPTFYSTWLNFLKNKVS